MSTFPLTPIIFPAGWALSSMRYPVLVVSNDLGMVGTAIVVPSGPAFGGSNADGKRNSRYDSMTPLGAPAAKVVRAEPGFSFEKIGRPFLSTAPLYSG